LIIAQPGRIDVNGAGLGLADNGVFQAIKAFVHTIKAFFQAFNLGLQQIAKILKASVHGIAEVVDAAVLEKDPEQVTADDDSDGTPLVHDWIH
jgi:hypothetical protein